MSSLIDRAFVALVEAIVGTRLKLAGVYRYRVVSQEGMTIDAEPVSSGLGLPPVAKVPVRGSIPGMSLEIESGTECVLGFLDGDASRPYIFGFDQTSSSDVGIALRVGDAIKIDGAVVAGGMGSITGPIALAPTVTGPGAPGTGHSRTSL